ncbi:hypothetical protein, partial [Thermogutta sp.]|uniref:hypothetical protein n=1 Tax=Thermogutta sp. TaxID=1962930 RepID=UPI00322042A9
MRRFLALTLGLLLPFALITTVLSAAAPPPPEVGRSPLPPRMGAQGWLPAPPIETQRQTPNLLVNG